MGASEHLDIDPRTLRLPPAREAGADPVKLQRQLKRFGNTVAGMPPLAVFRLSDGELMVYDGVTRATRVAKLLPGQTVRVEVVGNLKGTGKNYPTVGDRLP